MRGWREAGSRTGEPEAPGQSLRDNSLKSKVMDVFYSRCEIDTVRVLGMRCAKRRRGRGGAPHRTPPYSTFFLLFLFLLLSEIRKITWAEEKVS